MKVALFGLGYWGKKIYHTLQNTQKCTVLPIELQSYSELEDSIQTFSPQEILPNNSVSTCLIATPEETHFQLVKDCLLANMHVFVEKPLCLFEKEAKELTQLAEAQKKNLFVDYTFLFDESVAQLKKIFKENKLKRLQKISSVRHSVNIKKEHVQVTDDLAIHDIYLGEYFFGEAIQKVDAKQNSSQASCMYYFPNNKALQAEYSWSEENAARQMTFFFTNGKVTWDKTENFMKDKVEVEKDSDNEIHTFFIEKKHSALENSLTAFFELTKEEVPQHKQTRFQEYTRHVEMLELLRERSSFYPSKTNG